MASHFVEKSIPDLGYYDVFQGVEGARWQWTERAKGVLYEEHGEWLRTAAAGTTPDEDIMAIDVGVLFPRLASRVQVKCTSKFKMTGKSITMDLEPKWVASWSESFAPVYFVVVVVPPVIPDWIAHPATSTSHKTGAYWARFDPAVHKDKITVLKSNRFTLDTLHQWKSDVDTKLGIGGGV